MPALRRANVANRKIHFYRAVVPRVGGQPGTFDPTSAFRHIDGLPFTTQGRYLDEGDRILCCWIDSAAKLGPARFAVIRREGLPSVEEGGIEQELTLNDSAGLVEQIHVRCFANNIVGCEFNFYGPRLPSLGRYLGQRGGPGRQRVVFEPLVRQDVASLLDDYQGVRAMTLQVRRSEIDAISKIDQSLGSALDAQRRLGTAEVVEVTWRVKPYARGETLGRQMFDRVKRLARRPDIHDLAGRFVIDAVPAGGGKAHTLNILDDHLIAEEEIARSSGRGRGLDHASAFEAIGRAYATLEDELVTAASVVAQHAQAEPDAEADHEADGRK